MNKISYDVLLKLYCGYGHNDITWLKLDDDYESSLRIEGPNASYHDDYNTLPQMMDDLAKCCRIDSADDVCIDGIKNELNEGDYDPDFVKKVLGLIKDHEEDWK